MERPSFRKRANNFVRIKEQTDLEMMADLAQQAHRQAEGCGCHQCLKRAERMAEEFQEESWRVNVWSPDQEEEALQELALQKLQENKDGE